MRHLIASSLLMLGFAAACSPAYIDVATPKDLHFELVCVGRCGQTGVEPGTLINVSFGGGARGFSLCCGQRQAFLQQLYTVRDVFCTGGEVPTVMLGDLQVGTVVSEATRKRGATLDHGDGYVAFNCGEWLDDLIAASEASNCCEMRAPRSRQQRNRRMETAPAETAPAETAPAPPPPADAMPPADAAPPADTTPPSETPPPDTAAPPAASAPPATEPAPAAEAPPEPSPETAPR